MRIPTPTIALALALACGPASPASPPPAVVTTVAFQYLPGNAAEPAVPLAIARGTAVLLTSADVIGGAHTMTSVDVGPDAAPLFWSRQIGPGETADVHGTQALGPGSYRFYCTNHVEMLGVLTVR